MTDRFIHLEGEEIVFVLDTSEHGLPVVLHWGAAFGAVSRRVRRM